MTTIMMSIDHNPVILSLCVWILWSTHKSNESLRPKMRGAIIIGMVMLMRNETHSFSHVSIVFVRENGLKQKTHTNTILLLPFQFIFYGVSPACHRYTQIHMVNGQIILHYNNQAWVHSVVRSSSSWCWSCSSSPIICPVWKPNHDSIMRLLMMMRMSH